MEIIYTIPGLGTTKELFKNISVPDYSLKVLDWPQPEPHWKLSDYAKAFLGQIDMSSPVNLMGVSFGGMLCCEIASIVKVNKVVLISSVKNNRELPARIKFLKRIPLQKLISDSYYRKLVPRLSWFVGFEKQDSEEFNTMVRSMSGNYFKYCINMIINWERKDTTLPVYHIHGTADHLLPVSKIKNFEAVEDGNHAMILYKADEINTILKRIFNGR